MTQPLPALKAALHDIATWERHRIDFMNEASLRGQCQPHPDEAFGGWRRRLRALEDLEELLAVLIEGGHETAIRALDPRLALPPPPKPGTTPSLLLGADLAAPSL